ncbi:MAG: ribose 5-phosphate isomerase B [Candidatus Eisenbacteria bacterium]
MPVPDPAAVRRLVEAAVARVLGDAGAPMAGPRPATPATPPVARAARVVDWTTPAVGDTRPLAAAPPAPAGRPGALAPRPADPARTVAIGGDHGGYALKQALARYLREELRWAVIDCGAHSTEAVDYPDIARAVGEAVATGRAARGVVIDGAGIGSTMAANRVPGVRCALCHDVKTVLNSREHNDANVLALGAGVVNGGLARRMLEVWLKTPFAGGRHARRVEKIMELERLRAPAAERKA